MRLLPEETAVRRTALVTLVNTTGHRVWKYRILSRHRDWLPERNLVF